MRPGSSLPLPEMEVGDGDLDLDQDQDNLPTITEQSWLTLRRRCELCKQRKVSIRFFKIYIVTPPPFMSAHPQMESRWC